MRLEPPGIAVLGCGYWGSHLVRNFNALGSLRRICDVREEALSQMQRQYAIAGTQDVQAVLDDGEVKAVVIAAPAIEHFQLARRALLAGKDVFVEKPLALKSSQGRELVELASARGRILMVGHVLEYHPAIQELKELIQRGELGKIQYLYSSRLNLGKLRTEENILWSFAPHDISVILSLLGEAPSRVSAQGGSFLNPPLVDTTLSTLEFASGVKAHIFVSWLHPFKEQKLAVIGSQKMAVFDDVQSENKLVLYSHRISWRERKPIAEKDGGLAVPIAPAEPLRRECEHFLECVRTRRPPRTDGRSALRVLEVLEACERSLDRQAAPVEVRAAQPAYYAHPSAVIDPPAEIGAGTKIWHFSHIMAGAVLGQSCNLGQNVVISPQVRIGNNVKIQNNVSVYTGVELEDDVFCGPSMVFTNVVNPRSHIIRRHEFQKTRVGRGATLGANCTIVCGLSIGRYAFIAAGAVLTRDAPDFALMMGVPARRVGWVCHCGVRLAERASVACCPACGRGYALTENSCREAENAALALTTPGEGLTSASST
ncbi:MAG TPA: Gfo/Idh/MocA family oxidoreductase [Terriglobales bacterium]|nr:Gfo/Idh/MocA family oxidoreductase [Terriglobales bacterium]